jgi:methyltransferase family protein
MLGVRPLLTMTGNAPSPCRLCGGDTSLVFHGLLIRKHRTGYWRCEACGSLQTDPPYWLEDAYRKGHVPTDTGMAARTLFMAQRASLLLWAAGLRAGTACLDWGGGNGLFCRLMRDQGYNYFRDDKYVEPFYCAGFTRDCVQRDRWEVVSSFEVFEHLPNPAAELAQIINLDPAIWLFSTQLYESQGREWNYLSPNTGQHVFFYSEKSLQQFAEAHGREFHRGRELHLFVKRDSNPYFRSASGQDVMRRVLHGGKAASLAAGLRFLMRQRHAYRHWQADQSFLKHIEP